MNRTRSEDGDTLIEVLMALIVLGLAGVALIGAFNTAIGATAEHRTLSTTDVVLKDFAESATYQIQQQPTPLFSPCATLSGTASTSNNTFVTYTGTSGGPQTLTYQPPAGYAVQVTQTQYLFNNTTFQTSGCVSTQDWPQLITATATGPRGSASLSFVVADPQIESYVPPALTIPVPAPTISFPTTVNPYTAGHNARNETLHITGTNLQNASSVSVNGVFSGATIVSDTSTTLTITLTGSGRSGATGTLTVTTPDGTVSTSNSLVNGGTYNG